MKKAIIGNGGFGREIYASIDTNEQTNYVFFVDDIYYNNEPNTLPLSLFNHEEYEVIVAVGDPSARQMIVNSLPKQTKYFTYIHKSAQIHGHDIEIGEGSIICAGTIITTNCKIGKHTHLNLLTTIGHDNNIGDYFTTAPGVKISGTCIIGDRVYFGTNACSKQKIKICDDVIIGLNSGVVKDIIEPGTYIGTPVKKIK
jgi:sugar O-acyltransferase (sialic acid O-acetyltransferase NeuD family)